MCDCTRNSPLKFIRIIHHATPQEAPQQDNEKVENYIITTKQDDRGSTLTLTGQNL
jgi:hypothetical protein